MRGLPDGGCRGAHVAHKVHRGNKLRVGWEVRGNRVIGEVDRALARQAAPDHLGGHREQRSRHSAQGLQHRVEGVEGLRVLVVARPEAVTGTTHVPVREHVAEHAHLVTGSGDVAGGQRSVHIVHQIVRLGQDEPVKYVGGIHRPRSRLGGVQAEEAVGVPHRQHRLTHAFADAFLGDDEVSAAQNR